MWKSLWFVLLISSTGPGLISSNAANVNPQAPLTIQTIEELYNQALQTSIDNTREVLRHLKDTNAIDRQYFVELDKLVGTQDYYSTAYFIFALVHSSLFTHQNPDQLLLGVLPAEKIAIRNFYSKIRLELLKYFMATDQIHLELMRNVTRCQNETEDSLILDFLEFPQKLQTEVPELTLMDYQKQAKGLVEGIANQLKKTIT